MSHLERNETVQRLKERIACHGCLDADVSAIGRHQLVMEPVNRKAPCGWADVDVGSLVLATEGPGDGWWECLVLEAEAELFTLKWRDWPDLPRFVRRRWQLALLHPAGRG